MEKDKHYTGFFMAGDLSGSPLPDWNTLKAPAETESPPPIEINPHELYSSELNDIDPEHNKLDKYQLAVARSEENELIQTRGRWWLENGEDDISDEHKASRLAKLREAIVKMTDDKSPQIQNNAYFNAGTIYGLIDHYNDVYTDDEIDQAAALVGRLEMNAFSPITRAFTAEAAAGKNLGGSAYFSICTQADIQDRAMESLKEGIFRRRGFTPQRAKAWIDNIENNSEDDDLAVFHMHHAAAPNKNDWGIAEFTAECLIGDITPRNICELIQINKKIPSSELEKFEQNRVDAVALENIIYPSRTFIHTQHPGVHEFISAMIDYYDTKDDEEAHREANEKLENALKMRKSSPYGKSYRNFEKYIFNLDNYDRSCQAVDTWSGTNAAEQHKTVSDKAIDILRRLEKNTRPNAPEIPTTKDPKLNKLLEAAKIHVAENGKEYTDWRAIGDLLSNLNGYLISRQGENGMPPSQMHAIIYADRAATVAMRDITQKEWRELFFDPTFKEIVKFRDLTESYDNFSSADFERFWNYFSDAPAGETDTNISAQYYRLSMHIFKQLTKLSKHRQGSTDDLWSNNLTHELIGLTDISSWSNLREKADENLFHIRANY